MISGPRRCGFGPATDEDPEIQVRPGKANEPIDPLGAGQVLVVLLGSEVFRAAEVDTTTLEFGPAGVPPAEERSLRLKDANQDGEEDLVVRFPIQGSGIACGDSLVCVRGALLDGTPFEGCTPIVTVPLGCGIGFELALLLPGLMWLYDRRTRSARVTPAGLTSRLRSPTPYSTGS